MTSWIKYRKWVVLFTVAYTVWGPSTAQNVQRLDVIGITVDDMDIALDFYTRVLPFVIVSDVELSGEEYEQLKGIFGIRFRKVRLRLGAEEIELTDYLTAGGKSIPVDSRSNDLWFQHIAIVVSDMTKAYAWLKSNDVLHVSTFPQRLPKSIPAAEGIEAFYFRDHDGHNLELIFFPPGKGDPRWQRHSGELFLGVDHTAIGVSFTPASAYFYNNLLGLVSTAESVNSGKEQSHLNNIENAEVRITGNKCAYGPGVEFLQYLSPAGRRYPEDARADDLIHWEMNFVTDDIYRIYSQLKRDGLHLISKGIVNLDTETFGYKRGFYVRDPDGHPVGVFEK